MTIEELVEETHGMALSKGWYDKPRSLLEIHALIHSEISEATEEVRNNKPYIYMSDNKPEGEAVELADAVIRIADYFGKMGWDLEQTLKTKIQYNASRPYRHGGKTA